jgi:hypothetical protein
MLKFRHISVSSFVYMYDQWPHNSYMTGRAGVWEADDIVKFYIALLLWEIEMIVDLIPLYIPDIDIILFFSFFFIK